MRFQIIFLLFTIFYNNANGGQTRVDTSPTINGSDPSVNKSLARNKSSLNSIIQLSKLSKITINKKQQQQPQQTRSKSKKASKGIYHIKSMYNSLQNGNAILNDPSINTIRYVPAVKGN